MNIEFLNKSNPCPRVEPLLGKLVGYFFLFLAISIHIENAMGNEPMGQERNASLREFIKTVKQASEANAFTSPEKLSDFLPVTIQWRSKADFQGSPATAIAKTITLNAYSFGAVGVEYEIREPYGWAFFAKGLDEVACISFDEVVAILEKEYVVADKPIIHHRPGSPISRPGPQKMAGEKIIYQLSANANYQKNINVGISYAGCVSTLSSGQFLASKYQ